MSAETIHGSGPPQTGEPDAAGTPSERRRRRWLARSAIALAVTVAACLLAAVSYAARYQPVTFGGGFRGPSGPHLVSKQVNTTAGMRGQTYIPPQPPARGTFLISLGNTGPFPVTVLALSLLPPGMPASAINYGRPMRISGQLTYTLEELRRGQSQIRPRPLAGAVLNPGEYIYVRIPFLTARCWLPSSGWRFGSVWVTTRSLLWTHHVEIGWTDPGDPSQGAILSEEGYASPHAATHLVCPT